MRIGMIVLILAALALAGVPIPAGTSMGQSYSADMSNGETVMVTQLDEACLVIQIRYEDGLTLLYHWDWIDWALGTGYYSYVGPPINDPGTREGLNWQFGAWDDGQGAFGGLAYRPPGQQVATGAFR